MVAKKYAIFPIEIVVRELLCKLVLSVRLAEEGFTCFLGSKGKTYEIATKYPNVVFFDKGYHPEVSETYLEPMKKNGCKIISLDEEAGGVDFKDHYSLLNRFPEKVFSIFDRIFAWGTAQSEILERERKSFLPGIVKVTGHPRFTLLKDKYRKIFQPEADEIKKEYGSFTLFNSNTAFANHVNGVEFARSYFKEPLLANGKEIIDHDILKFEANIRLLKKLGQASGKKIIIRPHPVENVRTYEQIFGSDTNIHVAYKWTSVPWIMAADYVIHNDCTTAIETAMLGKRPISFNEVKNDAVLTWMPLQISMNVASAEEVSDILEGKRALESLNGHDLELLDQYFTFSKDNVEEVVNETVSYMDAAGCAPTGLRKRMNIFGICSRNASELFLSHAAATARAIIGVKGGTTLGKKLIGLDETNVRRLFARIVDALSVDERVRIECCGPYFYRIAKK